MTIFSEALSLFRLPLSLYSIILCHLYILVCVPIIKNDSTIGFDEGKLTALLVEYPKNSTNSSQSDGVSQGGISFEHSYFKLK